MVVQMARRPAAESKCMLIFAEQTSGSKDCRTKWTGRTLKAARYGGVSKKFIESQAPFFRHHSIAFGEDREYVAR